MMSGRSNSSFNTASSLLLSSLSLREFEREVQDLTTAPAPITEQLDIQVKSLKWVPRWAWILSKRWVRRLLRGLRFADGTEAAKINTIYTSGVQFRDDLVRLCMHAGYSARFFLLYAKGTVRDSRKGVQCTAKHAAWAVSYPEGEEFTEPVLQSRDVSEIEYEGRTWCVSVPSGLIIARRVHEEEGVVTKASAGVIVGNCQMGRGRTTTGMIIASLLQLRRLKDKAVRVGICLSLQCRAMWIQAAAKSFQGQVSFWICSSCSLRGEFKPTLVTPNHSNHSNNVQTPNWCPSPPSLPACLQQAGDAAFEVPEWAAGLLSDHLALSASADPFSPKYGPRAAYTPIACSSFPSCSLMHLSTGFQAAASLHRPGSSFHPTHPRPADLPRPPTPTTSSSAATGAWCGRYCACWRRGRWPRRWWTRSSTPAPPCRICGRPSRGTGESRPLVSP